MSEMKVTELFGSMVFNEDVMRQRLSGQSYKEWKKCVTDGTPLELSTAHEIANAMKDWALEKGATHYTHWFQPMTGVTAEKHDSFITPEEGTGRVLMQFSGKELVRGEPDASSFPSGGLRATFEARGYTAWDPKAFAFIKDGSLCIPTIFCSYSGQALDKKTPLLRSMDELSRQAVRIMKLFGNGGANVKRVISQVGPEQEYFLIDKSVYEAREDLLLTGRTLFGAKPPKGQELEDHYFGTIKPRVAEYMKDLELELWELGILAKTKHNEVAPAQHELAPIYTDANTACDHNQLTMEIMKKVAAKHGMVCLLHEKPFAGVNGSGKHNNWSLSTDTGLNVFKPGSTPSQNARFLLFLAAFLKGVDEYQELLRCTVANPGNDHRLGAQEAPPAIISVFLGDELTAVVDSIVNGTEYVEQGKRFLSIGVDSLPSIPQDNTDRNRTSPLAFTGNKFEFRMLGSSQSITGPNIALNTIMAEELEQFADILEKAEDFHETLHTLIRDTFRDHKRIIFNGNGYEQAWVEEAERRGLSNLTCTADALAVYLQPKHIELFRRHGVFTEEELTARNEIHLENYCQVVGIEARTMVDMVRRDIFPAVSGYAAQVAGNIAGKRAVLPDLDCAAEEKLLRSLSGLTAEMTRQCDALEAALADPQGDDGYAAAHYYRYTVFAIMDALRAAVDQLETITSSDWWPYPTYTDLLFSVK